MYLQNTTRMDVWVKGLSAGSLQHAHANHANVPKDISLNEKYDWEGGKLSFYHKLLPLSLKHEHRIKKGVQ